MGVRKPVPGYLVISPTKSIVATSDAVVRGRSCIRIRNSGNDLHIVGYGEIKGLVV